MLDAWLFDLMYYYLYKQYINNNANIIYYKNI